VVHGFATDGPDSNYNLFNFVVNGDEVNMTVTAPAAASLGVTATIDLEWGTNAALPPLASATRYLGIVGYSDGVTEFGGTVVSIVT
jgi:hypothetical protein